MQEGQISPPPESSLEEIFCLPPATIIPNKKTGIRTIPKRKNVGVSMKTEPPIAMKKLHSITIMPCFFNKPKRSGDKR